MLTVIELLFLRTLVMHHDGAAMWLHCVHMASTRWACCGLFAKINGNASSPC